MMWLFLFVVAAEESVGVEEQTPEITPEITLEITPTPTMDDVNIIFDGFLEQCHNGTYATDSFMSAICEMYNMLENNRGTSTSAWVSVIIDILAFLVGLVGVGYFVYLRVKKCKEEQALKEAEDNIEVEIQG